MSLDVINPKINKIMEKKGGYCLVPDSLIRTTSNLTDYLLVDNTRFGVSLPTGYKMAIKIIRA